MEDFQTTGEGKLEREKEGGDRREGEERGEGEDLCGASVPVIKPTEAVSLQCFAQGHFSRTLREGWRTPRVLVPVLSTDPDPSETKSDSFILKVSFRAVIR